MQMQGMNAVTVKELAYLTDSMKNEEMLTKLCVQGAVECRDQQLKELLARLAQERFSDFQQLFKTLQQPSQQPSQPSQAAN